MNDSEREDCFHQIETAIVQAGLSWVASQVDEEVRFGKLLTKKVESRPELPEELVLEGLATTRRSKIEVSATRPYTSTEKLRILVSALDQALGATEDMENAVRKCLSKTAGKRWQSVRLIRLDEQGREPLVIGPAPDEKRSAAVSELRRLMTSLREMI